MITSFGTGFVAWQQLHLLSQDERDQSESSVRHVCMHSKQSVAAIVMDICKQNERAAISIVCQAYRAVVPRNVHEAAWKAVEAVEKWLTNDDALDQCRNALSGIAPAEATSELQGHVVDAACFACLAAISVHVHEQSKFASHERAASPAGLAMHHIVVVKSMREFVDDYAKALSVARLAPSHAERSIIQTPELVACKMTLALASEAMREVIAAAVPQAMSVAAKWYKRTSKGDE
jgi:hypothetical protein